MESEIAENHLDFKVVFATSQMDQNPPNNVNSDSPYTEGWMSITNPVFPQDLIIDFKRIIVLSELKVVSHQTKIPKEISISISSTNESWRKCKFRYITSTKFTTNEKSGFKSREMRIAHFPNIRLRYIKIRIMENHINKFNKLNQVGIISIVANGNADNCYENDPEIAELEILKREAVDSEDFELAQEIKIKLDHLKKNKEILEDLKMRKEEAIHNEEYDLAQRLKEQIRKIFEGDKDTHAPQKLANEVSEDSKFDSRNLDVDVSFDIKPVVPRKPYEIRRMSEKRFDNQPPSYIEDSFEPSFDKRSSLDPQIVFRDDQRPIKPMNGDLYAGEKPSSPRRAPEKNSKPKSFEEIESQPIRVRRQSDEDLLEFDEISKEESPEPINERLRQESHIIIESFGIDIVQAFYSRSTDAKIRAIQEISGSILSLKPSQQQSHFLTFAFMLRTHIKEQIAGPFATALEELMKLVDNIRITSEAIRVSIEPNIKEVFAKLGRKNQRMSKSARNFIMWVVNTDSLGVPVILTSLLPKLKPPIQWAAIDERLIIINSIIVQYGTYEGIFELPQLITFIFQTIDSPKSEVRVSSSRILKNLSRMGAASIITKLASNSGVSGTTAKLISNALQGDLND